MKEITREMLLLAELLRELKSKDFDKRYPSTYEMGWKTFEDRVAQLEEKIKEFREEK